MALLSTVAILFHHISYIQFVVNLCGRLLLHGSPKSLHTTKVMLGSNPKEVTPVIFPFLKKEIRIVFCMNILEESFEFLINLKLCSNLFAR